MTKKILLAANEKPRTLKQWFLLSSQHVFAMFGATVLVPITINFISKQEVITSSLALFASGVGTIIYIIVTKAKVPVYLGSSFAYMTSIGTLLKATDRTNNGSIFLALFLVGLVYMLLAIIIYFTKTNWVNKVLPPVVIGPMIIIIGLSVAPIAINNAGLNPEKFDQNYPSWIAILISTITIISILSFSIFTRGIWKIIPILMGVIVGYIVALIFHFSFFKNNYEIVKLDLIINTNNWVWYPWFKSSFKGIWNFDNKIFVSALFSLLPLSLITFAEHIGDHINIGHITNKDYLKDPGLHRTLFGDGLATSVASLMGAPPNTTYGENASVVAISRVASVWVTGGAAVIAIVISFVAPINQLITMMPSAVMGGVGIILFGTIATNGIKILVNNKVDFNNILNIFIVGVMLILAVGQAIFNIRIGTNSFIEIKGTTLAAIAGIVLNLVLNSNWVKNIEMYLNSKSRNNE